MTLRQIYTRLYQHYGPQHWWPGDSPFEIMVGAILTQNTAWTNVEKAIANLKNENALDPEKIVTTHPKRLGMWLKPSGYFNIKAKRLKNYCRWYLDAGGFTQLNKLDTHSLRNALLSVNGVGPETADDIVLYAFERPVFVIDAYTRRMFSRLGKIEHDTGYEHLRSYFEDSLKPDVQLFNEYHALIVLHAKNVCKIKPLCGECCLARMCPGRIEQGKTGPGKKRN